MRKLSVGLVVVLVAGLAAGQVDPKNDNNGFFWNEMPEGMKLGFVVGYVKGMQFTRGAARWQSADHCQDAVCKFIDEGCDFSEIPYGQLEQGLDEFYRDFRNTSIDLSLAISYVRYQLRGLPADQLAKMLDSARQNSMAKHDSPPN